MSDATDWGARCDLRGAGPVFDRVWIHERHDRVSQDGEVNDEPLVVMGYRPGITDWSKLRVSWLRLRSHPHLLAPAADRDGLLVLRYAAIDWYPEQRITAVRLASMIAQVADVYRAITRSVTERELHWFADPLVLVDIGGAARLAFLPPKAGASLRDEREIVHLIGSKLISLCPIPPAPLGVILARCTHVDPKKRYRSLAALQKACRKAVLMDEPIRGSDRLIAWEHVEAGMGLVAVQGYVPALKRFEQALQYEDYRDIAQWGCDLARGNLDLDLRRRRPMLSASGPPSTFGPVVGPEVTDLLGEARRVLTAHDPQYAMAIAQELLRREPDNTAGMTVLVNAYFELGHNSEAIAYTDALVARTPGEGNYHYLRGKVLFRLGRLPEARDAFERALVLNPMLAEALHLRREVDRAIGSARKTVGSQHAPVLDVPASLEPLRDVLGRGNPREIIDALSAPEHDDNPDAQLVLARFLVLDGELGRASGIFHRLAEGPDPHRRRALVGKAGLLLQLGLLDSALALFDGVCAEAPSDLDASEGRAQALERLGRLGEAAAEYRRFVGLANARADLRVRVAQQWLDAHVL